MRIAIAIFFLSLSARALEIPRGLSGADRTEVVETIGAGASPKILSNPYPLGGYSGFEVGYSVEFINVHDINHLGCGVGTPGCANNHVSDDDEFRFSRITVGKGLYRDVDIFFSFAPPVGGTNISDYGGSLRWSFYQAEFLPITFTAVLHGNRMDVQDEFVNQNVGTELLIGISVENFALYLGGGEIWSHGTFVTQGSPDPGTGTVTNPNDPDANALNMVTANSRETHALVGISAQYQNLFCAAEIDHYTDSVYSMKVGMRF